MAPFEINKLKFLVNCGAFDRYLNGAPSGVLTLLAYQRNADDEVIVYVGEVFCRVPDCEHRKATPVAAAPAKRPLLLKRGGEVNKGEVLRILGLNARKDVPCAACKAADLPKRCIFNKAICDHLATFDIPEES
ncbi:uncharacterized protein N7458_003697 [Penicillium daleae]|uniref:Uncharacterized protein n=1 Tax=Penicillium daleae TaxID=63821 RepID=A0AAD6G4J1_9EURO|nr:uncharacterized protein N7458_003697 [Penicillium daleae]KAJ5456114.1 hypothetical protein N7458_003697 [Penicillium daleae]